MQFVSESFEASPLVSSAALPWQGVRVEQFHLEAGELPAHYHAQHLLMLYQVETPFMLQWPEAPRVPQSVYHSGDLGLYPGGEYDAMSWATPSDNVYVTVDDRHLDRVAYQGLDLKNYVLRERQLFEDPFLAQLSQQLLAAAGSRHQLGLLYVESLTNALCHHLLEHHATATRHAPTPTRLTRAVLARIDSYLEAKAEANVTLEVLADLANLSVFHFARLFKQATGLPPYQYVLQWKIRRAKHLLRLGSAPIADISDALGFASPASFSTAFRRAVGQSPQQFQRG